MDGGGGVPLWPLVVVAVDPEFPGDLGEDEVLFFRHQFMNAAGGRGPERALLLDEAPQVLESRVEARLVLDAYLVLVDAAVLLDVV